MNYGMCPNCFNKLTEGTAIQTGLSEIFKGNNSYLLCKNCQQVLLYNSHRDMIFDLDDYKEDEYVIAEINKLLSEIDSHYEVAEQQCSGDCAACQGCAVEPEPDFQRKNRRQAPIAPVEEQSNEVPEEIIKSALSNGILAVNRKDPTTKLILADKCDLDDINIDEWVFFEMNPIEIQVEIKKFYNIIR